MTEDIEQLRAENAQLRETTNQCRLAFAGYVSVQSAINKLDALPANSAPVVGVTVPVGAVEALANYQQGDMDGTFVLVSRQAIEECLPALRAIAGENGNG